MSPAHWAVVSPKPRDTGGLVLCYSQMSRLFACWFAGGRLFFPLTSWYQSQSAYGPELLFNTNINNKMDK